MILKPLLVSLPELPAVILAVFQEVGSVDFGVRKTAIGTLGSLSVVLALGDGAVIAVAPLAALNLVLQQEIKPSPLSVLAKVLHVKVLGIAVREAALGTAEPGHLLDLLVILALALSGDILKM